MTQLELDKYFETCIARWREYAKDPNNNLPEEYNTVEKLERNLWNNKKLSIVELAILQNWDRKCEQVYIQGGGIGAETLKFKKWQFLKNIVIFQLADVMFDHCDFDNVSIKYINFYDDNIIWKSSIYIAYCTGSLKIISQKPTVHLQKDDNFEDFSLDLTSAGDLNHYNLKTREKLLECRNKNQVVFESGQLKEAQLEEVRKELAVFKEKNNQPQEIFDFTQKIPREYWDPFATYFSGFKSFVKRAKGKNIGMELNVNGDFLFRIYSDNPHDLVGIQEDLAHFIGAINYYGANKYETLQKLQNGEEVSPYNAIVMEGQVNQLIQTVRFLQVENEGYRNFINLIPHLVEVITKTTLENHSQNQFLLEITKDIVYTEGKTDVDYLKTAIEVLGYKNFENVEIKAVGELGGEEGESALKKYWDSHRNKTSEMHHKIILLHDCDTQINEKNTENKLFKVLIDFNESNQKYKKGIENLLLEKCLTQEFVIQKKCGEGVEEFLKPELDKIKLCESICSKKDPQDFENFKSLLDKLTQILKN